MLIISHQFCNDAILSNLFPFNYFFLFSETLKGVRISVFATLIMQPSEEGRLKLQNKVKTFCFMIGLPIGLCIPFSHQLFMLIFNVQIHFKHIKPIIRFLIVSVAVKHFYEKQHLLKRIAELFKFYFGMRNKKK